MYEDVVLVFQPAFAVAILVLALLLMLLFYYWAYGKGVAREQRRVKERRQEIQKWMDALTKVRPDRPLDRFSLRDRDYRDLDGIEGTYLDDSRAADMKSMINRKLKTYEELLYELSTLGISD